MRENIDKVIGRNVRTLRKSRGVKLIDLGEELGYSESALSRKERGERPFLPTDLENLSVFFEVSVSYLFERSEPFE